MRSVPPLTNRTFSRSTTLTRIRARLNPISEPYGSHGVHRNSRHEREVLVNRDADGPAAEPVQPAQQAARVDRVVGVAAVELAQFVAGQAVAPTRNPPGRSTRTTSSS